MRPNLPNKSPRRSTSSLQYWTLSPTTYTRFLWITRTLNRCLREPPSAPASLTRRDRRRVRRGDRDTRRGARLVVAARTPGAALLLLALLLRGEHLRGRRVEHDGGLVVVLPARGTLRHLVVLRRQLHHCEENGDANGEISSRTVGWKDARVLLGLGPLGKKKKAGSRLAGAGSRRRAGGAGTHAGASTRRRSGTRICTDENVCPSRRAGCSRAGNPRPCRCRPRRPTSSRCVYSPSPSKKNCSLAHAGALCPPATRRFESRLFSREVSLTPESAALHAPRGRHRGLPSSPKTDERDDARLEKKNPPHETGT